MKNLIVTLTILLTSLVSSSQTFTVYADTCFFFNFSKEEKIDNLLLRDWVPAKSIAYEPSVYEFNMKTDTLTIKVSDNFVKKFKIKNAETHPQSKIVFKCQVFLTDGKIADVVVRKDTRKNTLVTKFEYVINSSTKEAFIHFNGKYEIQ